MAKLTISDAARVTGVSRVTLHRYIKAGKLSRSADGTIDTAELLRIGLTLQPVTVQQAVAEQRPVTVPATASVASDTSALERLIEVLQRELDEARAREQATREREALLLQMLQQMQQQNQRLLEAPRTAPAPTPLVPVTVPSAPRGELRRRIVALLREHPDGLSPVQTRHQLGIDKDLGATMKAMARDGLLRRIATGVYAAREA
jgi:hypothetical protein